VSQALLHKPFTDVVELLVSLTSSESHTEVPTEVDTHHIVVSTLLGRPIRATTRSSNVTTFSGDTQLSHHTPVTALTGTHAALKWKQWMIKCVDASPLVIETTQQQCVVIGSHSGHVSCMELHTGDIIWRTLLPDRIESSATLMRVHQQFYFCIGKLGIHITRQLTSTGCYDHSVYFLSATDGAVVWSYDLCGQVKSSAVQDPATNFVWVRSLYCRSNLFNNVTR